MTFCKHVVLSSAIILAMTEVAFAGSPVPVPLAGAGLPGLLAAGAAYGVYRLYTKFRG